MRVYLGSDHAGHPLRLRLVAHLEELGHTPVDLGPTEDRPDDDYPPYCLAVGVAVVAEPGSLGIVLGGSGNGEAIAANKVTGIRCALAFSDEAAKLARLHNDANVMSLGARMIDETDALSWTTTFVSTDFSGAERHSRRIDMLSAYERTGELPPRFEDAPPATGALS